VQRIVLEKRSIAGITYQRELVRCGKPRCKRCPHGPYWYAYFWDALAGRHGRTKSQYVGKTPPWEKQTELQTEKELDTDGTNTTTATPARSNCAGNVKKNADGVQGSRRAAAPARAGAQGDYRTSEPAYKAGYVKDKYGRWHKIPPIKPRGPKRKRKGR
jgi:hypothetical protein